MGVGDVGEVSGLVRGEKRAGGAARAAWPSAARAWSSVRAWRRVEADRRVWLGQLGKWAAATDRRG